MSEAFALWIRAETPEDAAAQGRAWADAEPLWTFVHVASVVPHPEFWQVWTVTVECAPVAVRSAEGEAWLNRVVDSQQPPLTLGLVE